MQGREEVVRGVFAAILVVVRLFESWRVTSRLASHHISIFGQRLSYPTANLDAIVIVLLAALGSVVTAGFRLAMMSGGLATATRIRGKASVAD